MKIFKKLKELFTGKKKPDKAPSRFTVVHTDYGRTRNKDDGKTRKTKMAKMWAAILEARRRRNLRTDREQRRVLRKRLHSGISRRGTRGTV